MSVTFTKVKRRLTPTGLWDNGLYKVSEEKVNFPRGMLREAVIEDFDCKGVAAKCFRITIEEDSWIVLAGGHKIGERL